MALPPLSKLDQQQILQSAFDEENRRLRTDSLVSVEDVDLAVDLDPSEDGVHIADKDSGNKLKVEADGSINVNSGASKTPTIQTFLISSLTEQSIILPVSTKRFLLKVRNYEASMQVAFDAGETSVDYLTVPRGCSYSEEGLNLTTLYRTIYFKTNKINVTVECVSWE